MKKILLALLLLTSGGAWAEGRSLKDWLKDLDARIRRSEERHKGRLTAAASVRGAKQDDAKKLYWKGRKENRPVALEEMADFKAALALAEEGKTAESRAGLEAFVKKYPGSPLEEDAKQTLVLLSAEPSGGTPAEAK